MKRINSLTIACLTVLLLLAATPRPAIAADWWDTVEFNLTQDSANPGIIHINFPHLGEAEPYYGFRLFIDSRLVPPEKMRNALIPLRSGSEPYSYQCEMRRDWKIYKLEQANSSGQFLLLKTENGFDLYDYRPGNKKYEIDVFAYRNSCSAGGGSRGYHKTKNRGVLDVAPDPEIDPSEFINQKLALLNQQFQNWRDLLTGNCGQAEAAPVDSNINAFIPQNMPACDQIEDNQTVDHNQYWQRGNNNFLTQEFSDRLHELTLGLFGQDMPEWINIQLFSLTSDGQKRTADLKTAAQDLATTINQLDPVITEEIYDDERTVPKLIKRKLLYTVDDVNVVYENWSDFKAHLDKLQRFAQVAVDTSAQIPGEPGQDACEAGFLGINAARNLPGFILCLAGTLVNQIADALRDLAFSLLEKYAGL